MRITRGERAADCQLAISRKHWADVTAEPDPSLWKMVANACGQPEAVTIR